MNEQEVLQGVTLVVTVASVVAATLPEPKTAFGKKIRKIIELLACNIGRAKRR